METITKYLNKKHIFFDIQAKNKQSAIKEMFDLVRDDEKILDDTKCYSDLLSREALESTAITDMVALPHTKTEYVSDILLGIGISKNGIDYDSKKIKIIIIFLAPKDRFIEFIQILGKLARILSSENTIEKLISSKNEEEVIDILRTKEWEKTVK